MRLLIVTRELSLGVEAGRIVEPEGPFDLVLEFARGEIRPGLINAHDHLHRNHYGRLGRPPYRNAYAWARDICDRERGPIDEGRRVPRRRALLDGAWKNLFAGVTSVVHHDRWEAEFDDGFPLRVVRVRNADSLVMSPELEGLDGEGPFSLHLAEGVDAEAAGEVRMLADRGLLTPDLIGVHGVGMDEASTALFRASGAALAWCPTSNLFLFGQTAPAGLLRDGLDVMLGSDSRLTGAGDLLDELRCAAEHGGLAPDRLDDAVGACAARRLGLEPPSLTPGARADLVVLARPLLEARAEDVLLVLADGAPRVAHPDLAPRLDVFIAGASLMTVGSVTRWTSSHPATHLDGRPHP